jgi:hypothetical protein
VWNTFIKLALPVLALALIALATVTAEPRKPSP